MMKTMNMAPGDVERIEQGRQEKDKGKKRRASELRKGAQWWNDF